MTKDVAGKMWATTLADVSLISNRSNATKAPHAAFCCPHLRSVGCRALLIHAQQQQSTALQLHIIFLRTHHGTMCGVRRCG
jgi:hypothetical protein